MEDDFDCLPDVSFADNGSTSNSSNSTSNHLKEKNTSLFQSPKKSFSRVIDFKEKIKKFAEYSENKKEVENIISQDGIKIGRLGDIECSCDSNENINLDENQLRLLNKLESKTDPLIPYKPTLKELFSRDNLKIDSYIYPLEFFSSSYQNGFKRRNSRALNDDLSFQLMATKRIDLISFKKFYQQISNNENKKLALDLYLLNSLSQTSSVRIEMIFNTINQMMDDDDLNDSKWYFSAILLLKFLISFGLDEQIFQNYFPEQYKFFKQSSQYKRFEANLEKSKNSTLTLDSCDNIELILNNLIILLNISLDLKKSHYSPQEIDFIFYLLSYMTLDSTYFKEIGLNTELSSLYSTLLKYYDEPE